MSGKSPESLVGQCIENRFEITALVGQGGMSTVYRAEHRQVELTVAVKVLKAQFAQTEENIQRFKREAKTVNSLFHPNIINMYSFGILETGEPYLVLDFLPGKALDDLIEAEKRLPVKRALSIFLQTCRGVQHAHDSDVLHRDLKPGNIMLVENDGEADLVKLVDFGIAKYMAGSGKETQQLTQAGQIFGSPIYMSPEQCEGKELDARSDVYSMGCVMYETLTGVPPLLGNHVLATMAKHMYEMPPPFAEAGPDLDLPSELESVVFRCLQKNPGARPQSMQELEQSLAPLA